MFAIKSTYSLQMATNFLLLLLLFFSCSKCHTDPPKILLPIERNSYTISEGDNLTVLCYGKQEVSWSFPNRHVNCSEKTGFLNIQQRLNTTNTVDGDSYYYSAATLFNANYLDTGMVECFYKSSVTADDVHNVDSFYLFVNSTNHALMPCSPPQDVCKLPQDTRRKSVAIFLANYSEFAPCKPTSEDRPIKIRAKSFGKENLLAYVDPFRGFQLLNATATIQFVECYVEGREDEICSMSLNYASMDPMCSLKLQLIETGPRKVLSYSNVTLQCEALCASVPTGYKLSIHPSHTVSVKKLPFDKADGLYRVRASLSLINVSRNHSGSYTCTLTRPSLTSQIAIFNLNVQDETPPAFISSPEIEHFVYPTDMRITRRIVLDCKALGTPDPVYKWLNGSDELLDNTGWELYLTAGHDAVGNFTCLVLNSVGWVCRSFVVKLFNELQKNEPHSTNLAAWISAIIAALCFGVAISFFLLGIFGYYRLRKRSRNVKLQAMWQQYFSDRERICAPSENSSPTVESLVSDSSESWFSEQLDQLPWSNVYEIDIDQLDFKEILGRGAFGVVFSAEMSVNDDRERREMVAVKSIKDSYDLEQYAALCSEIKLLSTIGPHLNVCNLLGAVTHTLQEGLLCMVIEYCDGGNLRNFLIAHRENFENSSDNLSSNYMTPSENEANTPGEINNNSTQENAQQERATSRLTVCDLATFAFQIANGMQFLHDRHCLHRDLAARNILLSSDNNVLKISDFGLARDVYKYGGEYRKKHAGKVPFKWLAPECIQYKIYNKQTDIWAYGVLLWEIFTLGKDPYPDVVSFDEEFVERLERGYRLPRPDFADDSIEGLIAACWHCENKSRPNFASICEELRKKLPSSTIFNYEEALKRFLNENTPHSLVCLPEIPEQTRQVEISAIYYR